MLSGDFNPMHLDPLAARRTVAGAPVVHGIHAALWALETLVNAGYVQKSIAKLAVRFPKFTYAGAAAILHLARMSDSSLKAKIVSDGVVTMTVDVIFGAPSTQTAHIRDVANIQIGSVPRTVDFTEASSQAGRLQCASVSRLARVFPSLAGLLGPNRVAAIAHLSTIVGMICPGLHSVFGELDLAVVDGGDGNGVSFQVENVDERVRMVELAFAGGGISGTATAFFCHPPVSQPDMDEILARVEPNEFSGITALVVGASRGLGALTAKAIAAGGGRVVLTYATGEADARTVAAEIGEACSGVLRYDVTAEAVPQLADLHGQIDQLYYFATPQIFRQKAEFFEPKRFTEFCRFYVVGFEAICSALGRRSAALKAFYPSSETLNEHHRDLLEYALAKGAGEVLCANMSRLRPNLNIVVKRLPRILTDQTASLIPVQTSDPINVILPIIREMCRAQ